MTKSQISAKSWLLLVVISLLVVYAPAAWLSDVPADVTRPVRTLIDDTREAGLYSVMWDGIDESNNIVSSGIYFYRLETSSKIETKKMLLMK